MLDSKGIALGIEKVGDREDGLATQKHQRDVPLLAVLGGAR